MPGLNNEIVGRFLLHPVLQVSGIGARSQLVLMELWRWEIDAADVLGTRYTDGLCKEHADILVLL